MRKIALAATLLITLTFTNGCLKAETQRTLRKEEVIQTEKVIKALLKPLSTRGVEVKSVRPSEKVKVPGFETFEVDLVDKGHHKELKRFIFINPKEKLIALQMFKYSINGENVLLEPLKPKNAEKPIKIDVSFFKEIDKALSKANIPHVVGKSDKKVYVVWDVFCPFCYRHFGQIEEIAKKNNVEIHLIPLAVHGENSVKGIIYYTKLARKKGATEALKELYNMGNGNFMKYAKALEEKLKKEKKITEDQEKIIKTLKKVEVQLVKNGVRATPTLIYVPPGKNKGKIHVGFIPIERLINEK